MRKDGTRKQKFLEFRMSQPWQYWHSEDTCFFRGAFLYIIGCLAALLAPIHWIPIAPLCPVLAIKNTNRHFHMCPGVQTLSRFITGLKPWSISQIFKNTKLSKSSTFEYFNSTRKWFVKMEKMEIQSHLFIWELPPVYRILGMISPYPPPVSIYLFHVSKLWSPRHQCDPYKTCIWLLYTLRLKNHQVPPFCTAGSQLWNWLARWLFFMGLSWKLQGVSKHPWHSN